MGPPHHFLKEWMGNLTFSRYLYVLGPGMWVLNKERQKINGNFLCTNHV